MSRKPRRVAIRVEGLESRDLKTAGAFPGYSAPTHGTIPDHGSVQVGPPIIVIAPKATDNGPPNPGGPVEVGPVLAPAKGH